MRCFLRRFAQRSADDIVSATWQLCLGTIGVTES